MQSRCNCCLYRRHFLSSLSTCFGLTGHLQVRSCGKATAVRCNTLQSEILWDGMVWIDVAQDRDQWRALVNTVMNFRVP
jgi:hypothetical protein